MKSIRNLTAPPQAHHHRFVVLEEHIDDLGHAGNVTWVRWINDAAIAHSAHIGLGPEAYARLGVIWVVRRHEIDYLVPALEGQTLVASTWVADLRGASSLRRTLFRREDGILLVRAATTWALVDPRSGRPRRIPVDLLEKYGFWGEQRDRSPEPEDAES